MIKPIDSWKKALFVLCSGALTLNSSAADKTPTPEGPGKAATDTASLLDMDLDALSKVEVREITTASKKSEKATAAPGTVQVISSNDIYLRGYTTLIDVLRDLPGMETTPLYFSELGTAVTVRGVQGNNKLVVMVNGMRVNPPGGEWIPLRADFFIKNADQIEVVYGPGSTLYGADAINGVVNIKTKDASTAPTVEGAVDYGMDNSRTVWGSVNHVFNAEHGVKLSGFFAYHNSDLIRLDQEYPNWWKVIKADATARGGLGEVPYRQDFGLNGFARIEGYNSSFQVWHRESIRSSSEGGYPDGYLPGARWDDKSTVMELRNKLHFGDKYSLEHIVTHNHYEIDPSTRYVWGNSPTTWSPDDYKYGRGDSINIEQIHTYDVSDKLDFLAGVVRGIYDIIPKATIPGGASPDGDLIAQGGAFTYYTKQGDPASIHTILRAAEVKYNTLGGYLEGHYQVLKSLKLVAGARIDTDSRYETKPVTPRLAVIYDVTNELTAKYSYARAFVQPAPYFMYHILDNGTQLSISNPGLQPESGETHEVSLNYHRANLGLNASAYSGSQNNLVLVSDSGSPLNNIQQVWMDPAGTQSRTLIRTVNSGESRNYGLDLSARAKLGAYTAWASYSYVHFETTRGGVTLPMMGASTHNGRVGLTWIPTPRLSITPSLMIRSKPENVQWLAGTEGSMNTLPYTIDVFGLYNLAKNVDIYAKITNLTDNHYGLANILGQEAPQETIGASVGLTVRF